MEQSEAPHPPPDPRLALKERLAALAGRLQGRALQLARNEADADDLIQQTLLRAWECADEERNGHFEGWLFTVMRNLWIDEWRRRSSHTAVSLDEASGLHASLAAPDGDPTATLKREDLLAFPDALRDLLAADGQTRLVRFVEALKAVGLDKQRIAEVMGFSEVRSVDAYLSELRKWCREHGVKKEHWLGVLIALAWGTSPPARAADEPGRGRSEATAVASFFKAFLDDLPSFIDRCLVHARGHFTEQRVRVLSAREPDVQDFLAGRRTGVDATGVGILVGMSESYGDTCEEKGDTAGHAHSLVCRALRAHHNMVGAIRDRRPQVDVAWYREDTINSLAAAWPLLRREPLPDTDSLLSQLDAVLAQLESLMLTKYREMLG